MENFFNDVFEFNLFKKALKATEGEPVVVNKLATDASINRRGETASKPAPVQHKNMSEKFEPSPFGRYFGSKRKRTTPLDMSDFSSWKNKNYRKVEETSSDVEKTKQTFSLSEYMKSKSLQKFNDLDQARTELKKPITQLSSDDPDLKKFALDSYMHKLEEEVIADDKFKENEDLLEPILNFDDSQVSSGAQDEDFSASGNNIERFAFDDETLGDSYMLDKSELDEVRRRLEALEKETSKFREEQNHSSLESEQDVKSEEIISLSDIIKSDEEDKSSLKTETVQDVNPAEETVVKEQVNELPRAEIKESKPPEIEEIKKVMAERKKPTVKVNRSNILTKDDYETMTDDFMSQFSNNKETNNVVSEKMQYNSNLMSKPAKKVSVSDLKSQSELEAKIARLAFENKKNSSKAEKKVLSDEGFKKELKSNYNISNLEMDNKLLKISNRMKKEETKLKEVPQAKPEVKVEPQPKKEVKVPLPEIKKTTPKTTNKKKRGKSRRRIDGDIIGEIDFD